MTIRDYHRLHGALSDEELDELDLEGFGEPLIDASTPMVDWPDMGEPPWAPEEEPVD